MIDDYVWSIVAISIIIYVVWYIVHLSGFGGKCFLPICFRCDKEFSQRKEKKR